jgi:hypothetical protein
VPPCAAAAAAAPPDTCAPTAISIIANTSDAGMLMRGTCASPYFLNFLYFFNFSTSSTF